MQAPVGAARALGERAGVSRMCSQLLRLPLSHPPPTMLGASAVMQPAAGPLSKAGARRAACAPSGCALSSPRLALGARCQQPRRPPLRVSAEKVRAPGSGDHGPAPPLARSRRRCAAHTAVCPSSMHAPPAPARPAGCAAAAALQRDDDTGFKTSPLTPAFTRRREHTLGRVAALGFAFSLVRTGGEECGRGRGHRHLPTCTAWRATAQVGEGAPTPPATPPVPPPPPGGRAAGGRGPHHPAAL